MQQANKAIKGIHKDLNPAKIDDMVNDMEENRATAEELNDAFNRIGPQAEFDEADLEEELAQMQQEAIDEKMTGVSAPLGEPAGATKGLYTLVDFICLRSSLSCLLQVKQS